MLEELIMSMNEAQMNDIAAECLAFKHFDLNLFFSFSAKLFARFLYHSYLAFSYDHSMMVLCALVGHLAKYLHSCFATITDESKCSTSLRLVNHP